MIAPPAVMPSYLSAASSDIPLLVFQNEDALWLVYDSEKSSLIIRTLDGTSEYKTLANFSLDENSPYDLFNGLQRINLLEIGNVKESLQLKTLQYITHMLIADSPFIIDSGIIPTLDHQIVFIKNIIRYIESNRDNSVFSGARFSLLHRYFYLSHLRYVDKKTINPLAVIQDNELIRSDLGLSALWWLRTCISQRETYFNRGNYSEFSQSWAIYEFTFDIRNGRYYIRDFLLLPENRFLLDLLEKWFLTNAYDIKNSSLLREIKRKSSLEVSSYGKKLSSKSRSIAENYDRVQYPSKKIFLGLLVTILPTILVMLKTAFVPFVQSVIDLLWEFQVFISLILIANGFLSIVYQQRSAFHEKLPFFQLPRFSAAILIGYLTLFSDNYIWNVAAKLPASLSVFLILAITMISFYYLMVGIKKVIGDISNRLLHLRVLDILVRGLITSFTLSLILNPILEPYYSTEIYQSTVKINWIIPLSINCANIFLFAVFALLIGILLQLLWEEKAITEPL
jgi:hypothetical protein